jgi:colanic acid/amylovoran biosynthesis protein
MKYRNATVCLLGASPGTANMGVDVLAAGTLRAFREWTTDGALFCFDYRKKPETFNIAVSGKEVDVPLVNIRFSKYFYLRNNIAYLLVLALVARIVTSKSLRERIISHNYWLNHIAKSDFVVSMAGGDSFSDIYGISRLLYVSLPQVLAIILGKKLVLLPQTIGPFNSWIAKDLAKFILRRAVRIYSRDHEGIAKAQKMLRATDANSKVEFCFDVGFVVEATKPKVMDPHLEAEVRCSGPIIGLNASGLLAMGGYSRANMFRLKVDYTKFLFELVDMLISKQKAVVVLIPHVFGASAESDTRVCQEIYSALNNRYPKQLFMVTEDYSYSEIKYFIGLCEFFIGSRMHSCIGALSQHVPTVSIAYSDKFIGVMNTIGVADLVADPRKLGKEEILAAIGKAFKRRKQLREHLERTIPQVKRTILNLFKDIGTID